MLYWLQANDSCITPEPVELDQIYYLVEILELKTYKVFDSNNKLVKQEVDEPCDN